jgi:hypothetical protein
MISGDASEARVEVHLAHLEEQIKSLADAFQAEKVSSKEAITAAFTAAQTATDAALLAQKEAAGKAEENATAQLEMHNGLIRKMDALVGGFPTKDSVDEKFEARDARLSLVEKQLARAYGAAAGGLALSGIALAIVLR